MSPNNSLHMPLGQSQRAPARKRLPRAIPITVLSTLIAALAFVAGWIALVEDPLGGEPMARADARAPVAVAAKSTPPVEIASAGEPAPSLAAQEGPRPTQTITVINGATGTRQQVQIAKSPGQQTAPTNEIIYGDGVRVTPVISARDLPVRREAKPRTRASNL